MNGSLAIVAYRSLIEGAPSGKIDIQVRWFDTADEAQVRATLLAEPFHRYQNHEADEVCWELVEVLAVEAFAPNVSGDEVIGIITTPDELAALA